MLGRVLFTLVGLIIAAGFVLPFYPHTGPTPGTSSGPEAVALLAGPAGFGCQDCPIADADRQPCPRPDCGCGERLAATFVLLGDRPVRLTLIVSMPLLPAEAAPQPTLPAI